METRTVLRGRKYTYDLGDGKDQIGVYELWYAGSCVRIGSGRIQSRLRDHHYGNPSFQQYRCRITNDKRKAIRKERQLLINYGDGERDLPKHNDEIPDPP